MPRANEDTETHMPVRIFALTTCAPRRVGMGIFISCTREYVAAADARGRVRALAIISLSKII